MMRTGSSSQERSQRGVWAVVWTEQLSSMTAVVRLWGEKKMDAKNDVALNQPISNILDTHQGWYTLTGFVTSSDRGAVTTAGRTPTLDAVGRGETALESVLSNSSFSRDSLLNVNGNCCLMLLDSVVVVDRLETRTMGVPAPLGGMVHNLLDPVDICRRWLFGAAH